MAMIDLSKLLMDGKGNTANTDNALLRRGGFENPPD
jgi:hypothetical protein